MSHDRQPPPVPAQVAPFAQVPGIDGAVRFILAFGGAELAIARNPRDDNELVEMFGRDRAEALAELTVPRRIPLAKPWLAGHFRAQGLSSARIARKLRVSDTSVRGYLRRADANRERLRADAERIERSRKTAREAKGV